MYVRFPDRREYKKSVFQSIKRIWIELKIIEHFGISLFKRCKSKLRAIRGIESQEYNKNNYIDTGSVVVNQGETYKLFVFADIFF